MLPEWHNSSNHEVIKLDVRLEKDVAQPGFKQKPRRICYQTLYHYTTVPQLNQSSTMSMLNIIQTLRIVTDISGNRHVNSSRVEDRRFFIPNVLNFSWALEK